MELDNITEADILDAFGMAPETPAEETPETPETVEDTPETPTETEDVPEQPEETPKAEPALNNANQKQNQAFARMRAENAQLNKILKDTASLLGIDTKLPPEQLQAALHAATNNAIAQKNNMDPAILERLEQLEARDARLTQLETTQRIDAELNELKTKFNLSDADMTSFVQELIQENFDVNAPGASIKYTWMERNYDKHVKAQIDAAVLAEQQRALKAGDASKPSGKRGQENEDNESKEINSVSALGEWLNGLSK